MSIGIYRSMFSVSATVYNDDVNVTIFAETMEVAERMQAAIAQNGGVTLNYEGTDFAASWLNIVVTPRGKDNWRWRAIVIGVASGVVLLLAIVAVVVRVRNKSPSGGAAAAAAAAPAAPADEASPDDIQMLSLFEVMHSVSASTHIHKKIKEQKGESWHPTKQNCMDGERERKSSESREIKLSFVLFIFCMFCFVFSSRVGVVRQDFGARRGAWRVSGGDFDVAILRLRSALRDGHVDRALGRRRLSDRQRCAPLGR
jgi:hypothetical protein